MRSTLLFFLVLLAPTFLSHSQVTQKHELLKPVYQHGQWGYADTNGKVAIEARFDAALPFDEGLARVGVVDEELPEIDGRPNILWGYIDESGRVAVPLRYNALQGFSEGLAAAAVIDPDASSARALARRWQNNLIWGYVDREGRVVIPVKYFAARDFSEGLAAVDVGGESGDSCGRSQAFGYLDRTGAFIIKPRFADASPFKAGRAQVAIGFTKFEGRCLCCAPRFVGQHGVIDRSGELVEKSEENNPDRLEVRR